MKEKWYVLLPWNAQYLKRMPDTKKALNKDLLTE